MQLQQTPASLDLDEGHQNHSEFESGWMEFEFDSSQSVKEEVIQSIAIDPKAEASGEPSNQGMPAAMAMLIFNKSSQQHQLPCPTRNKNELRN